MNFLAKIALAALSLLLPLNAFADYRAVNGPVEALLRVDPKSGIGTLELTYRGYLHRCEAGGSGSVVNVHLIVRTPERSEIFVRPMHRLCAESTFLPSNVAFFRTIETQSEPELWRFLRFAPSDLLVFEVAFESEGAWDSDYGRNFRIDF